MKIFIDSSKDSAVKKVHFNIDSTCIEISDLSSVSSVSIVEKDGEVFIDSVTKDVPVVEDAIVEVEPIPSIEEGVVSDEEISKDSSISSEITESFDEGLFQKLSDVRRELASKQGIPPYYIFHDKSLKEMAISLPSDLEEMKLIKGVGDTKLQNYGAIFLDVIQKHLQ